MLAYITGTIEDIEENMVVIDQNGIGFAIRTSQTTIATLPSVHEKAKLYTYMYVKEDEISLYGFESKQERKAFLLLIGISGIGPKAAISILSALSVQELQLAVMSGDYKAITKANGVGAKGAQRIVMELKDKLDLNDMLGNESDGNQMGNVEITGQQDMIAETALALTSLGYSNMEALQAIRKVQNAEQLDTETLLKEALKKIL